MPRKDAKAKAPKLLSGGNPQIAKGYGDEPVQAYIEALSGWQQDLARRLDGLITEALPGVRKAVKWNSPFYGIEGQGWLVSIHAFTKYLKVTFFTGRALDPVPPGGTADDGRWINVGDGELDETQLRDWLRQSATLPGWVTADIAG